MISMTHNMFKQSCVVLLTHVSNLLIVNVVNVVNVVKKGQHKPNEQAILWYTAQVECDVI